MKTIYIYIIYYISILISAGVCHVPKVKTVQRVGAMMFL